MAKVETVKIEADSESGFIIINKSDFTEKHTLFTGKKKAGLKVPVITKDSSTKKKAE